MPLVDKWRYQHMNKLVEREVFINSLRVKSAFCVSLVQERPQIVIFRVDWFGRLKWRATDLEASLLSYHKVSQRCSRNSSACFRPVSPGYAVDDISEEMHLNRSLMLMDCLGLVSVFNEKPRFVSRVSLFERTKTKWQRCFPTRCMPFQPSEPLHPQHDNLSLLQGKHRKL